MKRKTLACLILFGLFILAGKPEKSNAQGCSDGGACSIGFLEDSSEAKSSKTGFTLALDQSMALGEKFTFISQTALIADFRFLENSSLVFRAPFIFTSGNLGNSSGVGDVLISFIQQVYSGENSQLGFLVGGKLKSNNSDFSFADMPLPMAYQTSLGTYDMIVGAQYIYKSWDFYLAYQHPFGRNQNEYLNPPGETNESKLYFESAYLKRGDDIALRVQKAFTVNKKQTLTPGIMPIYRVQKSEILVNDINQILDGSNGLTLNLYLNWMKKLEGGTLIRVSGAFPVIDRAYRADGLTRNFVLSFRVSQLW